MDITVVTDRSCRASPNPEFKFTMKVGLKGLLGSEATIRHYTFRVETQSFLMNPTTTRLSHLDIPSPRSQNSGLGSASVRERPVRRSAVNPDDRAANIQLRHTPIFDRTIVSSPSRPSVAPVGNRNRYARQHSRIMGDQVRHFGRELGRSPENAGGRSTPICHCQLGLTIKHQVAEVQQREAAVKDEEDEEEEEEEEEERGKCAICLEAISGCGRWLPCSHQYHQHCIANWLQTRNVCPLCRSQAT